MVKDESRNIEVIKDLTNSWPFLNVFFTVALTIIFGFLEASFLHDIHTLRIHNQLSESLMAAFAFQLSLLVSFLFYLLSVIKWRKVGVVQVGSGQLTMRVSLAVMLLLQCVMMERDLAVAVYKATNTIVP